MRELKQHRLKSRKNLFLEPFLSSVPLSCSFELAKEQRKRRYISGNTYLRFNILTTESRREEEKLKFRNSASDRTNCLRLQCSCGEDRLKG